MVNLTSFEHALLDTLMSILVPTIPLMVTYVLKRFNVANQAALSATLDTALTAAAGHAYNYALQHDGGLASVKVSSAALAEGIDYVMTKMPDTLNKLGITKESVADMVNARIGVLLAHDPSVTAGTPKPTI